ncbi:MAG: YceH family protein [Solirubrobacteraceae bacterium]
MMDLDQVELRVLGCLIEKQRTTPDQYPLSLNALRLACNQTTNRDPVVHYDETTIREALHRLSQRRFTRLASGHSSRAHKFRHLLDEALALDPGQLAVLAVLMLRGAQTPGELKQRTDRMQGFAGLDEVHAVLDELIEREYAARIERRPGQKEERYRHRLSDEAADAPPLEPMATTAAVVPPPAPAAGPDGAGAERLDRLEAEVAELREEIARLREALGES